jgi:hypothetical protein
LVTVFFVVTVFSATVWAVVAIPVKVVAGIAISLADAEVATAPMEAVSATPPRDRRAMRGRHAGVVDRIAPRVFR